MYLLLHFNIRTVMILNPEFANQPMNLSYVCNFKGTWTPITFIVNNESEKVRCSLDYIVQMNSLPFYIFYWPWCPFIADVHLVAGRRLFLLAMTECVTHSLRWAEVLHNSKVICLVVVVAVLLPFIP